MMALGTFKMTDSWFSIHRSPTSLTDSGIGSAFQLSGKSSIVIDCDNITRQGAKNYKRKVSYDVYTPSKSSSQTIMRCHESGVIRLPRHPDYIGLHGAISCNWNYARSRALKLLRWVKNDPNITLFESDQRIVNGRLTLWISGLLLKNVHFSSYWINSDTGIGLFAFVLSPENYRKHENLIRAVLNGVVVN